jgi:hypothetical protein
MVKKCTGEIARAWGVVHPILTAIALFRYSCQGIHSKAFRSRAEMKVNLRTYLRITTELMGLRQKTPIK